MARTRSKSPSKDTVQDKTPPETVTAKASVVHNEEGRKTMSDIASLVEFSEDISNAEAPAPLPEGDYPAEIRAASIKIGATSGKPYGAVQFFIAPEAYPADFTDGDPDGTILTFSRVSTEDTPQGRHRMRKFCEAIGAKMGANIDLNDWIGNTATVQIGHGEWEGEKRAEIRRVVAA